jgi:hypothetical protein
MSSVSFGGMVIWWSLFSKNLFNEDRGFFVWGSDTWQDIALRLPN